ncbi:MAG: LptF/LptG family permease, partial [Desulfobacula sp.]|nr:LptF/LptG family permease [Desulfobacula sp.]
INIDLNAMSQGGKKISKDLDERSLVDLIKFMRSGIKDKVLLSAVLMELHEKFSIPFACLSLGLLAFPLGVQSNSLRRSSGFGLGVFFFLLYYLFLALGWSAGETGNYPPLLGMWLPNVIMGGTGIFLIVRNAKEKPVQFPFFVRKAALTIKKQFMRKI